MIVHKILPIVALGLNLLLLGSALAQDRRSPRNVLFAFLVTALAVWNLGVFGLRTTVDPDAALHVDAEGGNGDRPDGRATAPAGRLVRPHLSAVSSRLVTSRARSVDLRDRDTEVTSDRARAAPS